MKINDYILAIKKLGACKEAVLDAHNYKTSQELWDKCGRGDWMLWLAGKMSGDVGDKRRKQLVLTACKCARLSLKYVLKGELRPLKAIETAESWARGENGITIKDVEAAASAAADASAAYAAASAAASAAAYAAADAYAAAYAAADAYASAAADDAYDAYDAYARKETLNHYADIVQKDYPDVDVILKGEQK